MTLLAPALEEAALALPIQMDTYMDVELMCM
jgi:hypothetical protein